MNHLYIYKKKNIEEEVIIQDFELVWKDKKYSLFFKKYYEEISKEKENIDKLENNESWDKMKKIGNPYELIYTTYHRKRKNDSISKYIPLSRSYFKMWEIYNNYPIFKYFPLQTKFHFAHLAEGPGGFMEASYNYLEHIREKKIFVKDMYDGITLKPHNEYVPDWNKIKKIFNNNSNIRVTYGNLYHYNDVLEYVKLFENNKAHIVTADGGFDYSSDFNGQELNSCQIIYSEIVIALKVLIKNGTFICKVFDLFSIPMLRMIELLNRNFEYVYIYKPETSRPANSEKYIICMNFLDKMDEKTKDNLLTKIKIWNDYVEKKDPNNENNFIDFNNISIHRDLIYSLNDYNKEYIENQKVSLKNTIEIAKNNPSSIIEKNSYESLIKSQVQNAYNWCIKYNIPINDESMYWKKYSNSIKK